MWLDRGWIDYVAPQLYWEIGKKVADYKILAHWWAENCYGRNLYVGHYASALTNPKAADAWKQPNELCRQLRLNETIDDIDGSIMYSATPMLTNPQGLLDSLENNFYRYPALPPINRNIAGLPPMPPQSLTISGHTLHWQPADDGMYYVVYAFPLGETIDFDNPAFILSKTTELSYTLDEPDRYEAICVTAVNHYKQESMPCILKNYTY